MSSIIHPTKSTSSVQPRYVGRFSCIGPECEDSCCSGWKVTLDKKTFTAYRKSQHPVLVDRFSSQLKRNRSVGRDDSYGMIELQRQDLACPFLEEKLCAIQRELGEDKLSNTCATYPRSHRSLGGQHEQSLTLSCPQAARLALLEADAMDFEEQSVRARIATVQSTAPRQGLSAELMSSVRVFCLQLLRTQNLSLWQRLAVLALFCEQLTTLLKNSEHAKVPALIEQTTVIVSGGSAEEALAALQPDHDIQAIAFSGLWKMKIGTRASAVQESLQKTVAIGLGADPHTFEVTQAKVIERYKAGVALLPLAMKEVPFLLDHYVLNEMFQEVFPFGEKTPHEHFVKLVTRFGMVRLMLAAQCTDEKSLPSPEQMARTVQVFCRRYQHDASFAQMVASALDRAGWQGLEKLYRFLRA